MFPKRIILLVLALIYPLQILRTGGDAAQPWSAVLGILAAIGLYYFAFHRPQPLASAITMIGYDVAIFINAQSWTPPFAVEMIVGWVAAVVLVLASCMTWRDLVGWFSLAQAEQRYYYGAVVAITLVGAVLRIYKLTEIPVLNGDEASNTLFGMTYFDGTFSNPFISGWLELPSMISFIPGLAVALLGQTIWALRLPNILFGIMAIPLTIWAVRPLLARPYALIAGVVIATLGLHINFARINYIIMFDMLCAVGIIGLLLRSAPLFPRTHFVAMGVLCGIGQFGYANARSLAILIAIWTVLHTLRAPAQWKVALYSLTTCGLVTIAVSGPLLLHYYQYPNNFRAPLQRASLILPDSPDGSSVLTRQMAEQQRTASDIIIHNMLRSFDAIIYGPVDGWYSSKSAILPVIFASFFVLGIFVALWHIGSTNHNVILINIIMVCLTASLSYPVAAGHRMVSVLGSVALLIGLGAQTLDALRARYLSKYVSHAISYAAIMIAIGAGAYQSVNHYFTTFVTIENGAGDYAMQACSQFARFAQTIPAGTKVDVYETDYLNRTVTGVVPFLTSHLDYQHVESGNAPRSDAQVLVIPVDRLGDAVIPAGFVQREARTNQNAPMLVFAIDPALSLTP